MNIQKSRLVNKSLKNNDEIEKNECLDCYDEAIGHIRCAIDTLTNSKDTKKQTVEAVANLSVILFDLQNKR